MRGSLLFLFILCLTATSFAQENILERVSATERSDGQGYVIRYHLAQKVDSFRVYQPKTDLVQMSLYSGNVDTTGIETPGATPAMDQINFYDIPSGVGIDVYINKEKSYKADAYFDGNSNDLLLALTETSEEELKYMTEGLEPIIWSRLSIEEKKYQIGRNTNVTPVRVEDNSYQIVKNKMKFDVVVIDPGHGDHDPGSIGYHGIKEKNVVLEIAKKVGNYIKESPEMAGVKVVYTREDDTFIDLEERGSIANRAEGDLFVSIHCNAHTSPQPYGAEVFFLGLERSKSALETMKRENNVIRADNTRTKELTPEELLVYELANSGYIANSEKIAGMIEHQLDDRAARRSRGVKQARLVVLYHASMPAVLVETGFISNPNEARYLTSERGQAYIASAIFRAIRNYKLDYEKSQNYTTN